MFSFLKTIAVNVLCLFLLPFVVLLAWRCGGEFNDDYDEYGEPIGI